MKMFLTILVISTNVSASDYWSCEKGIGFTKNTVTQVKCDSIGADYTDPCGPYPKIFIELSGQGGVLCRKENALAASFYEAEVRQTLKLRIPYCEMMIRKFNKYQECKKEARNVAAQKVQK